MTTKNPRQPKKLPEGLPEWKACPDCAEEGRSPYILPVATHFYIKRAARYPGGFRVSAYCKEHESKRAGERVKKRVKAMIAEEAATGVAPPALERRRQRDVARSQSEAPELRQERLNRLNMRNKERTPEQRREADRRRNWEREQRRKRAWYLKNRVKIIKRRRELDGRGADPSRIQEYRPRPWLQGRQEPRVVGNTKSPTRRRLVDIPAEEPGEA